MTLEGGKNFSFFFQRETTAQRSLSICDADKSQILMKINLLRTRLGGSENSHNYSVAPLLAVAGLMGALTTGREPHLPVYVRRFARDFLAGRADGEGP